MGEKELAPHIAARRIGVSVHTLTRWRRLTKDGEPTGPAFYQRKTGRVFYRESDLDAYKESLRVGGET